MATATNASNSSSSSSSPRHIKPMTSSPSSSPWNNQISRAVESDPLIPSDQVVTPPPPVVASPPPHTVVEEETLENGSGSGNGAAGKRPAWNKPSNGHEIGVGPVMGAHSWPALSDAARASSTKSASLDSLKGLAAETSTQVAASQGSGPTANVPSSPQRQNSNSNPSSNNTTHTAPSRQRSMKRNANPSFNGGTSHPPSPHGFPVDGPMNSPSPRDITPRSGFVSQQSHGEGGDHPPQRTYRNRNGGHPRGGDGGSHHHNSYGGTRRDSDWNHRSFNGRETQLQSPRGAPRFMRPGGPPPPPPPPPSTTPFVAPQLRQAFVGNMGFPEMYFLPTVPPESLRGMVPFMAQIPVYVSPPADPQLYAKIVNQIDYYFSNENLIKDTYLRNNMDEQGWVPIRLIAGFKKMSSLTNNIQLILIALQSSTAVEVQGDKVRRRDDWMNWILPRAVPPPPPPPQANAYLDTMTNRLNNLSVDPNSTDHNTTAWSQLDARAESSSLSRSSSGDINNNHPGPIFQGSLNHLGSARNSN
ncbi:hypothetical protein ACFE04_014829 [Oxalis oulophora]